MEKLTLGIGLLSAFLVPGPTGWARKVSKALEKYQYMSGVWICGEDLPQEDNRTTLHATQKDQYGLPIPIVSKTPHINDVNITNHAYDTMKSIYEAVGSREIYNLPADLSDSTALLAFGSAGEFSLSHHRPRHPSGDDLLRDVCTTQDDGRCRDVDSPRNSRVAACHTGSHHRGRSVPNSWDASHIRIHSAHVRQVAEHLGWQGSGLEPKPLAR